MLELPEVHMESDEQLVTGFHHNTVLSLAPEIIEAVKKGRLSASLLSPVVMHREKAENIIVN